MDDFFGGMEEDLPIFFWEAWGSDSFFNEMCPQKFFALET